MCLFFSFYCQCTLFLLNRILYSENYKTKIQLITGSKSVACSRHQNIYSHVNVYCSAQSHANIHRTIQLRAYIYIHKLHNRTDRKKINTDIHKEENIGMQLRCSHIYMQSHTYACAKMLLTRTHCRTDKKRSKYTTARTHRVHTDIQRNASMSCSLQHSLSILTSTTIYHSIMMLIFVYPLTDEISISNSDTSINFLFSISLLQDNINFLLSV